MVTVPTVIVAAGPCGPVAPNPACTVAVTLLSPVTVIRYTLPADACEAYTGTYQALQQADQRLTRS